MQVDLFIVWLALLVIVGSLAVSLRRPWPVRAPRCSWRLSIYAALHRWAGAEAMEREPRASIGPARKQPRSSDALNCGC